jgi:hypothetical protein
MLAGISALNRHCLSNHDWTTTLAQFFEFGTTA